METRRTNRDAAPRRRYRLTPAGLASLRASIRRVTPWERSTGPRTLEGKARSRLNATKHGERSAEAMARRRELTTMFAVLRDFARVGDEIDGYCEGQGERLDVSVLK